MNILRNLAAIIAGYAIFVISAVLLFQLTGIDPHADPTASILMVMTVYGILFSFVGGWAAAVISKSGNLTVNYILAGIMAAFATFSLYKSSGNHYSQLAAIFLFAPSSLIAGVIYLKTQTRNQN